MTLDTSKFKVPAYDEDPGDDMVNWLNENPGTWEGDEGGVIFWKKMDGHEYRVMAVHNDFIWRNDVTLEYWVETPEGVRRPWEAQS